jgi:hypothetical protein
MGGNGISVGPTLLIGQGLSAVYVISDVTEELILLHGEQEVAWIPISLVPGELFLLDL